MIAADDFPLTWPEGLHVPTPAELAEDLGLSRAQFRALDPRLHGATLVTAPGVARLRRWLEAGKPEPDPDRLTFSGDEPLRELVLAAIAMLPPPVAWHAVVAVVWIGVGRSSRAWTSGMPRWPAPPAGDQLHLVVVGPTADIGVVGHELGHSWHRRFQPFAFGTGRDPVAFAAAVLADIEDPAERRAQHERFDRQHVQEEALADATARRWGFDR